MYNLLVTSSYDAWENDNDGYTFDKSRFLEYTTDSVAARHKQLTSDVIEALKSYPTIFAYEGDEPVRIGYLTLVREQGRQIYIEFEFLGDVPPIPFDHIEPLRTSLDIRDWEMNRTHWAIKDDELLPRLAKKELIPAHYGEPKIKKSSVSTINKSLAAKRSLQGFIESVLGAQTEQDYEVFFRGHASKSFKLEPSVFRTNKQGDFLYRQEEQRLYQELLVANSDQFQNDSGTLDRLVRMQHYSLPTRLLDITTNPLIALFFACKEMQSEEGEVIVFNVKRDEIRYFDSDLTSCIANLARLTEADKRQIDFDKKDFNDQPAVQKLLDFIKQEKPHFRNEIKAEDLRRIICVKGKRNNNRITSQAGAFLLFGEDAIFDEETNHDIKFSRIRVGDKSRILRELDQLNINDSTVFPNIENTAKYVAQKFKFSDK